MHVHHMRLLKRSYMFLLWHNYVDVIRQEIDGIMRVFITFEDDKRGKLLCRVNYKRNTVLPSSYENPPSMLNCSMKNGFSLSVASLIRPNLT